MGQTTIGVVAKQAQVKVDTVRYYERRGLLPPPARRASGYRMYAPETVTRIQFIRRAQRLGFSLEEIGDLLSLSVAPQTSCGDVKQRAEAKLADIECKLANLERMRQALLTMTAACSAQRPASQCPMLAALEGQDQPDA